MGRQATLEKEARASEARKMSKEEKLERKRKRAKARRRAKRAEAELTEVYKPLDEWDDEELARGRPRAVDGTFRGSAPTWVTAELLERATKRFKEISQSEMRALTADALLLARRLITSQETDRRGRPLVPVTTQWDAAKWLLEMLHGKPTQRQEIDLSVKLQGILANAMVQPDQATGELMPAIDVPSWEDGDDEDDLDEDQLAG